MGPHDSGAGPGLARPLAAPRDFGECLDQKAKESLFVATRKSGQ